MMEAFAQRYCLCNPGVFQSTGGAQSPLPREGAGAGAAHALIYVFTTLPSAADTCYVLSFAVIMLNTSLHNPNVRDKPGLERFVAMNRGINEGGDLPEELLRVRPPLPLPTTPRPVLLPATDPLLLGPAVPEPSAWEPALPQTLSPCYPVLSRLPICLSLLSVPLWLSDFQSFPSFCFSEGWAGSYICVCHLSVFLSCFLSSLGLLPFFRLLLPFPPQLPPPVLPSLPPWAIPPVVSFPPHC